MRRILFQVHLWIGLILCIPFVLLGVSGSILVFDGEIQKALSPEKEIHASTGPIRPLDEIAAAALKSAPNGARVTAFNLPEKPGDPATVRLGQRGAGPRGGSVVAVDPATLAVLGTETANASPLFRIAHDLHGRMLINGPMGRPIVGWLGVGMCILGFSGLILWWPKKGQLKRALTIARGAKGYRFNRDLHGMLGFWSLCVFLIVSLTGVFIAFPEPITKAIVAVAPGRDLRGSQQSILVEPIRGAKPMGLQAAADLARQAVPDARLLSLAPAGKPDQPLRITMAQPGWQERTPSVNVFIDPLRAKVLEVRDPRAYTAGENIQAWQRALHEGSGFGLVWKWLVFLIGLAPVLFAITGVTMWVIKNKQRAAAHTPADERETEAAD
jgi:uncharacterized iron-regulated membrane protein